MSRNTPVKQLGTGPPHAQQRDEPQQDSQQCTGDHEARAQQEPPNVAHAELAISKQTPPSLYGVPANSTRAEAAPRAPGGARHGGGNRAVTSRPRAGQSTSYGDVQSSHGGGRRVGQEWVRERGTLERQQTGVGATQDAGATPGGTRASRQGGGAQQGRRGNQDKEPERRGWESMRMGGSDNKGDSLAS